MSKGKIYRHGHGFKPAEGQFCNDLCVFLFQALLRAAAASQGDQTLTPGPPTRTREAGHHKCQWGPMRQISNSDDFGDELNGW